METNFNSKSKFENCRTHKNQISEFFCSCKKLLCILCISSHDHNSILIRKRSDINSIFQKDFDNVNLYLENHQESRKDYTYEKKELLKLLEKTNGEVFDELSNKNELEYLRIEMQEFNLTRPTEEKMINFICDQEKLNLFNVENLINFVNNNEDENQSLFKFENDKSKFLEEYKNLLKKYFLSDKKTTDEKLNLKNKQDSIENMAFSFKPTNISKQKQEENRNSDFNNINDTTYITKTKNRDREQESFCKSIKPPSTTDKIFYSENKNSFQDSLSRDEINIDQSLSYNKEVNSSKCKQKSIGDIFSYDNIEVGTSLTNESLQKLKEKNRKCQNSSNFSNKEKHKCKKCNKDIFIDELSNSSIQYCEICFISNFKN
jgi:hypothetical protein